MCLEHTSLRRFGLFFLLRQRCFRIFVHI
jgi:hypothetical protein